jgi:predicted ATPase
LSPIDYSEKHRKIQKAQHIGTCQWLFKEENYVTWENSSESAILSVFGIPGCGKTVLASCLIQKLQGVDRVITTYHYCDYKDPRSLDPVTIAGTLINGLLERIKIADELSALIENSFKEGRRSPDESEMFQLLDHALQSHLDSTIYIVVDGVDEVDEQSRKLLFRFLEHITKCRNSIIKLAITSRSDFSSVGMKLPPLL